MVTSWTRVFAPVGAMLQPHGQRGVRWVAEVLQLVILILLLGNEKNHSGGVLAGLIGDGGTKDLSHCNEYSYKTKTYLPIKSARKMPLLLGMPNSGVVWMRDILEQFTGAYTGSVGMNAVQNLRRPSPY
jgi:hypothetical protein